MKKYPKTAHFGHILRKVSTSTFGAWSFSMSTFDFTHIQGSKGFENAFKKKSDHGRVTMDKCPLTWDKFMVHDLNNPCGE